jgi:carbon-monoxide dehydrogenase medium subunit
LRRLPKFEYFRPDSFEEAIQILKAHKGRIRPIAGGTDIIVAMKEKGVTWENLLDLKGIKGFDLIRDVDGHIEIGALTSIRAIEKSSLLKERVPFLTESASVLGSVQVRNMATVGGNICNAAPSAELAPALIGLRATLEIIGDEGPRIIPVEDFFIGPGQCALGDSELLRKFIIQPLPEHSAGAYFKHSPRKAMDIAVVGVGCVLTCDGKSKKCTDARVVLGAVAPTPMRAKRAESALTGKIITESEIREAASLAGQEARPITDVRGSAQYRREMVKVFTARSICEALKRLGITA